MKRRSFFALVCGGIAGLFGVKPRPRNPFQWGAYDKEFWEIWRSYDSRERSKLWGIGTETILRLDKEASA